MCSSTCTLVNASGLCNIVMQDPCLGLQAHAQTMLQKDRRARHLYACARAESGTSADADSAPAIPNVWH